MMVIVYYCVIAIIVSVSFLAILAVFAAVMLSGQISMDDESGAPEGALIPFHEPDRQRPPPDRS